MKRNKICNDVRPPEGFFTRSSRKLSFPVTDTDFVKSGWCGKRPKCVMVAVKKAGVALRDSKDSSKSTLFFTKAEWKAFTKGVKDGQFD